jgi:extradiol dioxygenase family protein
VIVNPSRYASILKRLMTHHAHFAMPPQKIFVNTPREQDVFLVFDPSGNAIEIKGIDHPEAVFSQH